MSAAVGHRLVDDGDLDAATEMLAGLPPPWSWDLGHAIARARARGEAAAARSLAAALPFAPWRAAVQAELVSGADETTIEAVLVALPPDSRAASRANAAVLAPTVVAERLLLDAAATPPQWTTRPNATWPTSPSAPRSPSEAACVRASRRGRAAITGHQVRARAQVAVIEQLARGPADLGRDDVLAVLAGDPMSDADSLVAVRAAVLATTPPGPGTAAAVSALLAELRRLPGQRPCTICPRCWRRSGPSTACRCRYVARDLTAVCGWWP